MMITQKKEKNIFLLTSWYHVSIVKQLGLLVSAQDKTDKNSHTAEKLSNVC
jgi:hypothetical protein